MIEIVKNEPLVLTRSQVPPAWIDYNGHMNLAYYLLAADNAYDVFLSYVGIDAHSVAAGGGSTFALENHIVYQRELEEGAPFEVTMQLLEHDHKRLHTFFSLRDARDGAQAATVEGLSIYVDMATRRSAEMPKEVRARVEEIAAAHGDLAWPEEAGRKVGIRRR